MIVTPKLNVSSTSDDNGVGASFSAGDVLGGGQSGRGLGLGGQSSGSQRSSTGSSGHAANQNSSAFDWMHENMRWFENFNLQPAGDFAAGLGHVLSGGITSWINGQAGTGQFINKGSGSYQAGKWTGYGVNLAMVGSGIKSLYEVPKVLYHFTSWKGAASITAEGIKVGTRNLYGPGVYLTRYPLSIMARLQGAGSTEAMIPISTEGLEIVPTLFPGTFRALGTVPW